MLEGATPAVKSVNGAARERAPPVQVERVRARTPHACVSELRERKNRRKKSAFRQEEEYRTTRIPQWKAKDLHVIILSKVDPADAVSSTASGILRVLQFSQNCSISAQQQQQQQQSNLNCQF